ncbi:MAG: FtsX-like permease family protein [Verrucomicrobia bacterium]|jgi:putative ABC transport system permease protein|nr:FtsX-like permease family protein [Verrucomicrobiota bacterium]
MWLHEFKENVVMALSAIAGHKLRSALTLLGVMIGVFSIIVVMTAVRVLQNNIESQLSQLGANSFQVRKFPGAFFGVTDFEKFWRRKDISYGDGIRVQERATLARSVGLESDFWGGMATSRYGKSPPNVRLFGETPGSFPAKNWVIGEGRNFMDHDLDSARAVCILAGGLADVLFPHSSALGEEVKLDGIKYQVVGVLETKGQMLGGNQDNFVIIPLTTGLNRYGRRWRSLSILVQAPSQEQFENTREEVRGILRVARKVPPGDEDDFEIFSNDSLVTQFQAFTLAVRVGMALISSISLLAAGIGIMNIMLVSVTERTREIGVRRAIGAKKRNIITQFIVEAIVLCEVGGLMGVALGILGGNAVAFALEMPVVIPIDWIFLGLLICSFVGIIFGTYPAVKAANLDPIESLRYE